MAPLATDLLDLRHPLLVPEHIGEVRIVFVDDHRKVAPLILAYSHRAPRNIGFRFMGGCKFMDQAAKFGMIDFYADVFEPFEGLLSGGGTRMVTQEGEIDPIITELPAALAKLLGDKVLTISTTPLTGEAILTGNSQLVLDPANGILPQPGVNLLIVFQAEYSHETIGWNGDVKNGYIPVYNMLRKDGRWPFGGSVWNGAGITYDDNNVPSIGVTLEEAILTVKSGWPSFVVRDTDRAAQDIVDLIDHNKPIPGVQFTGKQLESFVLIERDNVPQFRRALRDHGLLTRI